jgi:transposase-like protein
MHNQEQTLSMSPKERERLKVLHRLDKAEILCADAAESLDISERHLYRLRVRYRTEGDEGLIHRLRGCLSNRGYSRKLRIRTLELYRERYSDYGPTLFAEMIAKEHSGELPLIDHETLRRWLLKASLWAAERTRKAHRRKRERREQIGALVQFDGSDHDWFEGRGPWCTLLVAIDDASGRVFMRFARSENAHDVLLTLRHYVEQYGIPREIYTDKANIYHPPSKGEKLTDVGRTLTRLGVRMIVAHSPQAKGRVERSNRTHQDRLVKALRHHNISTIDAANRFLEQLYLKEHNNRFACTNGLRDIHRPADGIDLNNIFCFETTRRIYNDFTITLNASFIQLERSRVPLPSPGRSVTVRRWLDNSLHIFSNNEELSFTMINSKPKPQSPSLISPLPPGPNHPWKHKNLIGRARYRKATTNSKLIRKSKQNIVHLTSPPP